jgi:hypothetical protein
MKFVLAGQQRDSAGSEDSGHSWRNYFRMADED